MVDDVGGVWRWGWWRCGDGGVVGEGGGLHQERNPDGSRSELLLRSRSALLLHNRSAILLRSRSTLNFATSDTPATTSATIAGPCVVIIFGNN